MKQSFVLWALITLLPLISHGYPEFIGYGYSSCLTCHFNGQGSGALNDYGRALWSAEIASRWFYPKNKTDEQIAEESGFLGKKALPDWIRPALKYRGISVITDAFTSNQVSKFYNMQLDANITLQNNLEGKYLASFTYGNEVNPKTAGTNKINLELREYFIRVEPLTGLWLYAGLLEKVFGIRNIDHTSYQRKFQGFGIYPTGDSSQNIGISNSQGLIAHKIAEKWETTVNYFVGHPRTTESVKHKGFSLMHEHEVGENKRVAASVLDSKSQVNQRSMLALSYKQSVGQGSAFLGEYGVIKNTTLADGAIKNGSYAFIEAFALLNRGYHFRSALERHNESFEAGTPDKWKFTNGLFFFPIPRIEVRTDFILNKSISDTPSLVTDDRWTIQGQIHVSL